VNFSIRAYVDIETTGLNRYQYDLTVVGICLEQGRELKVVQLYDSTLTGKNLLAALQGVTALYTFNGERFDLPFIEHHLGLNLARRLEHCDLMYCCWDWGLWGGQKKVECRLGIGRKTVGLDGADAVELWLGYKENGSKRALRKLLEYNAEDVTNLAAIRRALRIQ
jgi:uncharacterized protein YprB with RNaseH-like and TPR domain